MITKQRKTPNMKALEKTYDLSELTQREELALERFVRREAGEDVNTDHLTMCGTNAEIDERLLARALVRILHKKEE